MPNHVLLESLEDGESKFARALASGDYHTRENGWRALQIWLQRKQKVSSQELSLIWKGIMFCFWHSDKAHVQEQLAAQLSDVMLTLNKKVAMAYFKAFLKTMFRDWSAIDRLRLDKFMMLVRKMMFSAFCLLDLHSWESDLVAKFSSHLLKQAFRTSDITQSIGFGLHVADVYLTELNRCCERGNSKKLQHETILLLLEPFIFTLQYSKQSTLLSRVQTCIFEELANTLRSENHTQPFDVVKSEELGEHLFSCGAAEDVHKRNRKVLYATSQLIGNIGKKKRSRESAAVDVARLPNGLSVVVNSDSELGQDNGGCAPVQKRRKNGAQEVKQDHIPEPANGVCSEESLPDNAVRKKSKKEKKVRRELEEAIKSEKKKGGKKSARQASNGVSPDTAGDRAHHKAKKVNGLNGVAIPLDTGRASLSSAVEKVEEMERSVKKRISFNLSKNVVHQIGKPLPPPEIRTPPSARPNGSALKKVSSVGTSPCARKLLFS